MTGSTFITDQVNACCQAEDIATLLDRYQHLDTSPDRRRFHIRLGLSVINATGGIEHHAARRIAATDARYAETAHLARSKLDSRQ